MSERSAVTVERPSSENEPTGRPRLRPGTTSHARNITPGFIAKMVLVALVDALGVYGIIISATLGSWGIVAFMAAALVVVNWVYFSRRMLPAKYLVPGLLFLLVYQVYVMAYTGYVAFTNYGSEHMGSKSDAVASLLLANETQIPDSPMYPLTVLQQGDEVYFAIVDGGVAKVGSADQPLTAVEGAVTAPSGDHESVVSVPDFVTLQFAELLQLPQKDLAGLRVAWSEDPADGSVRTDNGMFAFRLQSAMSYDAATDTLTNTQTGVTYTPNDKGSFVSADGEVLTPGWRVAVGFDNFTKMFTDSRLSGSFMKIFVWTFAFASLSVLTTFALGLFLAIVFNDPRVRGRKVYRSLLILPYAFPAFLSALIWKGMLNTTFGYVNEVIFGGAAIPWLEDPNLAKFSIIAVNLWLGFPYMFLICTGALQSIPGEVTEAARIDGAGPLRIFRSMTLPLLLVSVTPLLIASFAFNFNNFALIYMLTGGGPEFIGDPYRLGSTDILISMVYTVAMEAGGVKDYGLASAMSIIIFVIVGLISWLGFRRTRSLEEIN